ncbi:carbon starvation CstA family protein [Clostridium saccharobutylicum]|uniref:Carbon starvation protein A n=1 Tax=Clostridium saccharobutylicum TaxID=169679 RepID=A0A1S8N5N7_CLOSA|nr:carbon starvation protein A [Clostridium saccharobutylicum]OOM11836.1 carbon starvation protein A [Clostridium saccharobutylicum]
MNSIVLVIIGALILILGYRFYGAFIAAKVLVLDETRKVPSEIYNDGKDYVPTNKWVLLGHHFAAIAGAGPLIGPVLAAQFGYLPGALWILIGSVAAGAVHDIIMLFASVRFDGESIAEIAKRTLGKRIGFITSISVIFILIITMAGLGLPVVNSLYNSPWGTFTVGSTIPIAIFVGIYLKYIRPGKIAEGTIIGMTLILLAVIFGPQVENTALGHFLTLNTKQLSVVLALYGFCAAALPVWLLLLPRDYLSTYMKLGVIGALVVGIILVRPQLQMPAITQYVHGGGPVVGGKVFPFLFITIACGALSGFHSLISTGTTPKLIKNEKDIYPIGYGSMVLEAFVALMALIAATALPTADYFAINSLPDVFEKLNLVPKDLGMLESLVGETLSGRPGGSVSLAVGMTYVFHNIPILSKIMPYWYHFCIMFEALFILTTIDSGTRIGRYLLQDLFGKMYKPLAKRESKFNLIFFSALMSLTWGSLLYSGNISTIWPLFGVANQTLAGIAFAIGTSVLIDMGKRKYTPITILPMIFISVTTITASIENIFDNYIPNGKTILTVLSFIILAMLIIILYECIKSWKKNWNKYSNNKIPTVTDNI